MNDNYKKWNEMICQMIDRNYNVECTGCRDDVKFTIFIFLSVVGTIGWQLFGKEFSHRFKIEM